VKGAQEIKLLSVITSFSDKIAGGFDLLTGRTFEFPCDTLVSSFGGVADDRLYFELKGTVPDLRRIGDCVAPRTADMAIYDGGKTGRLV
jgi:hypothetical protein